MSIFTAVCFISRYSSTLVESASTAAGMVYRDFILQLSWQSGSGAIFTGFASYRLRAGRLSWQPVDITSNWSGNVRFGPADLYRWLYTLSVAQFSRIICECRRWSNNDILNHWQSVCRINVKFCLIWIISERRGLESKSSGRNGLTETMTPVLSQNAL